MIKIDSYTGDSFAFYESVVNSCRARKDRPRFVHELRELNAPQKQCYTRYDRDFSNNSLQELEVFDYEDPSRDDLRSLYNYRNKRIEELRIALTKHPKSGRLLNTCQNCTINEVDTMDHIVPKEEFPEFAVHPKNLFPCCSSCNRTKSKTWRLPEGERVFLNLYLDPLPKEQYLFVDFDSDWLPTFSLRKPDEVSVESFRIIQSHYERLNLCKRFQDRSHETISKLEAEIKAVVKRLSPEIFQDMIHDKCSDQKRILGFNHWQLVLEEALADNKEFIEACVAKKI